MEKKQFPDPQEEPVFDELVFTPQEELIDELPMEEPAAAEEVLQEEPVADLPVPAESEDASACSDYAYEEPVNEEPIPEQMPVLEDNRTFMEKIPNVDEDYPPEEDFSDLVVIDEDETQEVTILDSELMEEPEADQEYRDSDTDFAEIYQTPTQAPPPPPKAHPPRKGRPKRKKGEGLFGIPNMLATVVWLALILAIGVTAGRMLWLCASDVLAFGRPNQVVTINIYESDDMDAIIEKLHKNGLIRYKGLFKLYADISDAQEDIKPGVYDLNTRYDYHALVNFMSPKSNRGVVEVTIPEGYTCAQIFDLLEENRVCTARDAANYAATGELNEYWFLEGVERGTTNCLEGYLFPDTYEFYKNSTPREALQRMLNNFENRFSEEMRAQIDVLNEELTGNYTVREITIVASLIEKESAAPAESPKVAGVIYNRLFNWDSPAYLNIDASIVYAQGGVAETIDTNLDSPYNTYTNVGLTPGPISNPGLASLRAALNPESHDYYYYVLNPSTGMHQFSESLAQHNAYIREFYGE